MLQLVIVADDKVGHEARSRPYQLTPSPELQMILKAFPLKLHDLLKGWALVHMANCRDTPQTWKPRLKTSSWNGSAAKRSSPLRGRIASMRSMPRPSRISSPLLTPSKLTARSAY